MARHRASETSTPPGRAIWGDNLPDEWETASTETCRSPETSSTSEITDDAFNVPTLSCSAAITTRKRRALQVLERRAKKRIDHDSSISKPLRETYKRSICVKECPSTCPGAIVSGHGSEPWCSMPVMVTEMDWRSILRPVDESHFEYDKVDELKKTPRISQGSAWGLPREMTVHIVEELSDVAAALDALRASMSDPVIGIDLEWRPDHDRRNSNRVALIQLASSSVAVLIRVCQFGYVLPEVLRTFFADSAVTFVSFSWHSGDESKMNFTFGEGKSLFSRFIDLQRVAEGMGYRSCGLAFLTQLVLGVSMPKSRAVSRSDWQRRSLSASQIRYAVLDALVTGLVFRSLRLWHASPSSCIHCKQLLGVAVVRHLLLLS